MPLLNLPAMGMPPQRFVQLPARDNFPEGHGLEHPYTHSLLLALCACQGLGPDQVVGQRAWWAERRSTVVCFERMVVPIIRYTPCGHVFVEPRWAGGLMRSFKQHLYGAFGIPVAPAPLRTITYLHRAQNRRITNRDEVLQVRMPKGARGTGACSNRQLVAHLLPLPHQLPNLRLLRLQRFGGALELRLQSERAHVPLLLQRAAAHTDMSRGCGPTRARSSATRRGKESDTLL